MSTFRTERDSMGELTVPAHVMYGATTQRAVLNFPVSGQPVPREVIHAFATINLSSPLAGELVEERLLGSGLLRWLIDSLCDGEESIKPARFKDLMTELKTLAPAVGREL